jgi:hypothetical protein
VKPVEGLARQERRDQAWVASRIGRYILIERPDTLLYVIEKLGLAAGCAFLQHEYRVIPALALDAIDRAAA